MGSIVMISHSIWWTPFCSSGRLQCIELDFVPAMICILKLLLLAGNADLLALSVSVFKDAECN
jgi:hypothetical protein